MCWHLEGRVVPEADGLSWTWKARQAELAAEQGGDAAGVRGGPRPRVVETLETPM